MKYLFGDATTSPLDRNYIEFLRDLLEFSVAILASHSNSFQRQADLRKRKAEAAVALEQLREVGERLNGTLAEIVTPQTAPETAQCVEAIRAAALQQVKGAAKGVQANFATARNNVNGAIEQERAKNLTRLEKLLLRHDLQESIQWVNLRLDANGAYVAELVGRAASKMSWVIDVKIPDEHLFSQALRLDRLAPQLAVKFPVESGWVRKSVKLRSYKLSNKYVTEILFDDKKAVVKLRNARQSEDGFDLVRSTKTGKFSLKRLNKGELSQAYQPEPGDLTQLEPVWNELMNGLMHLKTCRHSLRAAVFDGKPIQELMDAPKLVERLVQQITPVVQAISHHSQSPNELVLKRVLDDNRREEIYASKAELFQLLAPLPPELLALFKPLGLHEGGVTPSSPGVAANEVPTQIATPPNAAAVKLTAPLPRPSAPPPPKRQSRRRVQGRKGATPRKADADPGQPAESVDVPLDGLEKKK